MSTEDKLWPWFAVMVKTGREKDAKSVLETLGYTCFFPSCKFSRRWSDRTKKFEGPLFPGYLFCRLNPLSRLPILKTPGVLLIVGIGKTPTPIQDVEIAAIQRVAESGLYASPWPCEKAGDQVRLNRGPLEGLTGTVINVKSEYKLVLSIELLQRSVAVEINRDWIGARLPAELKVTHHPDVPLTNMASVPYRQEASPRPPAQYRVWASGEQPKISRLGTFR